MSSSRQRGHGKSDSLERRHNAEQKRQWAQAEYVAAKHCPGGTVTQVGDAGFHVQAPGKVIAEFVPWPEKRTDDWRFGRISSPL